MHGTEIRNETTGATVALDVDTYDGINYLDDVLGMYEVRHDDEAGVWVMDDDEVTFWRRWCDRQTRINMAMAEADEATREACQEVYDEGIDGLDNEQDALEAVLGIDDAGRY